MSFNPGTIESVDLDELIRERVRAEIIQAIADSDQASDLDSDVDENGLELQVEGGRVRIDVQIRTSVRKALALLASFVGAVSMILASLPDPDPLWRALKGLLP